MLCFDFEIFVVSKYINIRLVKYESVIKHDVVVGIQNVRIEVCKHDPYAIHNNMIVNTNVVSKFDKSLVTKTAKGAMHANL